jgi:hypothetical protein
VNKSHRPTAPAHFHSIDGEGAGGGEGAPVLNPFERLYAAAGEKKNALEALRVATEALASTACPFRPDLAKSARGARASAAQAAAAAAAAGAGEGAGEGAGVGAGEGAGAGAAGAFERLYGDASARAARAAAAAAAAAAPSDPNCTFEPALSATTRRITQRLRASPASAALLAVLAAGEAALAEGEEEGEAGGEGGEQGGAAGDEDHLGRLAAAALLPRHLTLYEEGLRKARDRRAAAEAVEAVGGLLQSEALAECTFQPNALRGAPPAAEAAAEAAVHERLFHDANQRRSARESADAAASPVPSPYEGRPLNLPPVSPGRASGSVLF